METQSLSGITIEGFARGGIFTSIGVPEVGAIFDTGIAIPTCLRYGKIFITHGHPDHIMALTQVVARRSLQDLPNVDVYVPSVIKEHIEDIFESWWKVNGGRGPKFPVNIHGRKVDDVVRLKKNLTVHGVKTYHRVPSVGWSVDRVTNRLKPEFQGMEGKEIGEKKRQGIEVTDPHTETILTIPGDTTIDFLVKEERARKSKILIHEVTYWDDEQSTSEQCRRYGHTHFRDMIKHCDKFEGEFLVLCHRSMKFSRKFVEKQVRDHFPKEMIPKIRIFDGGDKR